MAFSPTVNRKFSTLAVAAIATLSLTLASSSMAAQPTVGLGSTDTFAVLAGSGITNTGATTVSGTAGGDMGSSPTGSFTGDTEVVVTNGTKYTSVDSKVTAAKDDLVIAYNDAAGRTPVTTVSADLGGQTLKQGVYNSASSLGLTGTVTLDAENDPAAVFIFQAGSSLTTASSSKVALINGAQACNVFWQVGSSATLGTTTDFVGHVFALNSISVNDGVTVHGQLLARNGAVTLIHDTIINDKCADVVSSPTPSPEDSTDTGGQLPNTDTSNWVAPLAIGLGVVAAGSAAVLVRRRRR